MKYWKTYVDLALHAVFTLLLAWFFYRLTGGWLWPALAVLGGIFIDVDHLIDYFLYYGYRFNLKDFIAYNYMASGKIYIVFHSIELITVIWIFSLVFSWAIPLASGMTLHILIDAFFSHRTTPLFLFLIYRWRKGFSAEAVCPRLDFNES
ncbi:MAG: hypothetical protein WBD04_06505 [Candidatus Omnitrophota bacterium]